MPKLATKMTDKKLRSLTKDTSCGVVPGLIVVVRKLADGSFGKYFSLLYTSNGKRIKYNLGAYPSLSLSAAFEKAQKYREMLDAGEDPEKAIKEKKLANVFKTGMTVEQLVWKWIEFETARGKWDKNADKTKDVAWSGFFKNHFKKELRQLPVVQLTPEILAAHFSEKWMTMVDTPERILSDLKNAIDWGVRQRLIPPMSENPARISGGRLGDLLPLERPSATNRPALHPNDIPDFFVALADLIPTSQAARCLAYAILTAARNSTARESTWNEIVLEDPLGPYQLIARSRMKIKGTVLPFDRKTPLSKEAIGLLKTAPRFSNDVIEDRKDWCFPNIRLGRLEPISEDSLTKTIKDMHARKKKIDKTGWVDENVKTNTGLPRRVTPHGLARASFKTWANDSTRYKHPKFDRFVLESCLDHRHEKYACAYDREQSMGEMREVFDEWGKYCYSKLTKEQKLRLGVAQ